MVFVSMDVVSCYRLLLILLLETIPCACASTNSHEGKYHLYDARLTNTDTNMSLRLCIATLDQGLLSIGTTYEVDKELVSSADDRNLVVVVFSKTQSARHIYSTLKAKVSGISVVAIISGNSSTTYADLKRLDRYKTSALKGTAVWLKGVHGENQNNVSDDDLLSGGGDIEISILDSGKNVAPIFKGAMFTMIATSTMVLIIAISSWQFEKYVNASCSKAPEQIPSVLPMEESLKPSKNRNGRKRCLGIMSIVFAISMAAGNLAACYFFPRQMSIVLRIFTFLYTIYAQLHLLNIFFGFVREKNPEWVPDSVRTLTKTLTKPLLNLCNRLSFIRRWHILALPVLLIVPTVWFVGAEAASPSSVAAQIIGGILICTSLSVSLLIPRFWLAASIQLVFVAYDVFAVFITPMFTADKQLRAEASNDLQRTFIFSTSFPHELTKTGISAMEYVAYVFKSVLVFRLFPPTSNACVLQENAISMLGFGDVVIPSVLGNFCCAYDIINRRKRVGSNLSMLTGMPLTVIYIVTYSVSLVLAFVVAITTGQSQPALTYVSVIPLLSISLFATVAVGGIKQLVQFDARGVSDKLSRGDKSSIDRIYEVSHSTVTVQ